MVCSIVITASDTISDVVRGIHADEGPVGERSFTFKVFRERIVIVAIYFVFHYVAIAIAGPVDGGAGSSDIAHCQVTGSRAGKGGEGRHCPTAFAIIAAANGAHLHDITGSRLQIRQCVRMGGVIDHSPIV